MPLCLEITDVTLSRGERRLCAGLTVSVVSGEILLVTGPNGTGKTTLLRAIAGFIAPDSGLMRLSGAAAETTLQENIHFVGHRDGLKGALTVRENLTLAPALLSKAGETVDAAAERLSLEPLLDLPVSVLSAGQRRRVALARLLVAKRPIWLLDEPTSALDTRSTEIVAEILQDHVSEGGIVIAATHLPLGITGRALDFATDGTFVLRDIAQ